MLSGYGSSARHTRTVGRILRHVAFTDLFRISGNQPRGSFKTAQAGVAIGEIVYVRITERLISTDSHSESSKNIEFNHVHSFAGARTSCYSIRMSDKRAGHSTARDIDFNPFVPNCLFGRPSVTIKPNRSPPIPRPQGLLPSEFLRQEPFSSAFT